MTRVDHQSVPTRIFEALSKVDPEGPRRNRPSMSRATCRRSIRKTIRAALRPLEDPSVDIATLTVEIEDEQEKTNPNVREGRRITAFGRQLRALYFTPATAPHGAGPLYHHIGLYAYRRAALETLRVAVAVDAREA